MSAKATTSSPEEQPEKAPTQEPTPVDPAPKEDKKEKAAKAAKEAERAEKAMQKKRNEALEDVKKRIKEHTSIKINQSIIKFANEHEDISDVISTGDEDLDRMISPNYYEKNGHGGVPRGFLCELFGPHGGGKTALCLNMAANATQNGELVLWVDAEGSFVNAWAEARGVNINNVVYIGPGQNGEQYLSLVEALAPSKRYALIVIDSMVGLVPKVVLDASLEDTAKIGATAQMMSRSCPRLIAMAKEGNCTIAFINQIRNKIGVMYGSPETTPGGEALKFFSSLRLRISQLSKSERGIKNRAGDEIGIRSKVETVKNRFGPPYKTAITSIFFSAEKPHPMDVLLDMAISKKVVKHKTHKDDVDKDGEPITYFSFEHIEGAAGIDELKSQLDTPLLVLIAQKLAEKTIKLPPEVVSYIEDLKKDAEEIGA